MIDLEKLIPRLVESGVAFVIVGGVAACIHGSAQVTVDLDICYARDEGRTRTVIAHRESDRACHRSAARQERPCPGGW